MQTTHNTDCHKFEKAVLGSEGRACRIPRIDHEKMTSSHNAVVNYQKVVSWAIKSNSVLRFALRGTACLCLNITDWRDCSQLVLVELSI